MNNGPPEKLPLAYGRGPFAEYHGGNNVSNSEQNVTILRQETKYIIHMTDNKAGMMTYNRGTIQKTSNNT